VYVLLFCGIADEVFLMSRTEEDLMSPTWIKRSLAAVGCVAVLSVAACESTKSSPTGPTETVTTTIPPAPAPATGSLQVTVTPNPVPFSGQPITDAASCAGSKNTWFYQQILKETGGAAVTITGRIDKFDQRVVNTVNNLSMAVPANGSLTVQSRWCSAQAVAHTAQTTFTGTDANGHTVNVDGAMANLRSP
jgi:hypothetical protein